MLSRNLTRQLKHAVIAITAVLATLCSASPALANTYSSGYVYESWEFTGGPANSSYTVQQKTRNGWTSVSTSAHGAAGGTTDANGADSGWLFRAGPNSGISPFATAVRVIFSDGTIINLTLSGPQGNAKNVSNDSARFDYGTIGLSDPLSLMLTQNMQEFMDLTGQTAWLQSGSFISIQMPLHFKLVNTPYVQVLNPGDLILGAPMLENSGQTLTIPVIDNLRMDPFNGFIIENMVVQYDGVSIPLEYSAVLDVQVITTPVGDPSIVLEAGNAVSGFHIASVFTDPVADWFDETNSGKGFANLMSLIDAHDAFNSEYTDLIDLEDLELGEKLADQYLGTKGVYFSGADGGADNSLTGIAAEGTNVTEVITGYDGSYQPDGSQVYIRFDNTLDNPDAPFTIHFTEPQRSVAAFLGCGVQGSDHSFTVTAYDGTSEPIDVQQVTSQLWEDDPTGQNYETLFAVKSAIPNIRSVSIVNNSSVDFANALLIDSIEFSTSSALTPGDTNFDGSVDTNDLLNLLASWGECLGQCICDLDGDGNVSTTDLLILLSNWGPYL